MAFDVKIPDYDYRVGPKVWGHAELEAIPGRAEDIAVAQLADRALQIAYNVSYSSYFVGMELYDPARWALRQRHHRREANRRRLRLR